MTSTEHLASHTALYREHLLLGAEFGSGGRLVRYGPNEIEEADSAWRNGALLAEVSQHYLLLASGTPAQSFAEACCAGSKLSVGACAFEGVLAGDGSLVSVPLVARTGNCEYLFLDRSARADILDAWLSFLSTIEQGGVSPYAGIQCDEVSGTHVTCLLWGNRATETLADYMDADARMPEPGEVCSCLLDRIPCIVLRPRVARYDCYVLMIPPQRSVALWRSLLSFPYVMPVGQEAIDDALRKGTSWWQDLEHDGVIRKTATSLRGMGLVRQHPDFVGARGLSDSNGGGQR